MLSKSKSTQLPAIQLPVWVNHILISIIVLSIAWLSLTAEGAENSTAYTFPQILAVCLLILWAMDWVLSYLFHDSKKICFTVDSVKRLFGGLIAMLVLIFVAEEVGFYLASWTFATITIIYYNDIIQKRLFEHADTPPLSFSSLLKNVLFGSLFMGVMYVLFTILLHVQTPRGWLI